MPTHQADWTTLLLQAINRVQTAYIRHQESHLPLTLLLDSLTRLTGSAHGFVGEISVDEEGESQIQFHHKGDTPWQAEFIGPDSAPVAVKKLIEQNDSIVSDLLTAQKPFLHNGLPVNPGRSGVADAAPEIHAFLGFPLVMSGRRLGVVGLSRTDEDFDESIVEGLQPLIRTATNILDARHQQARSRRAEKALSVGEDFRHTILDTTIDAVITCDELDRIIEFNPAAEKMLGWKKPEILGRQASETLVPPDLIEEYRAARRNTIELGDISIPGNRTQTRLLCNDGSHVPVDVSVSQTVIDGSIVWTGFFRDISRQIEDLERYQKALQELESANQAKRKFVATMSHEIRTPLNVIRGGLSLLETATLESGEQELVRVMHDSSNILLSLVNDVLDFSKIESEAYEALDSVLDPADLVDSTIRVLSVRAFRNGTNLCFYIDPRIPATITADAGRVRQVLINLVGNAIKYSAGGHVEIRLKQDLEKGLRFEVEDDGPGIPEERRDELFSEFSQAHDERDLPKGGTGLGLAISKRLIDMMGGEIGLESEQERNGSTFWFTVPLRDASGRQPGSQGECSGVSALLIGSDRPWRRAVQRQLEAWQIDTTCITETALSGEPEIWQANGRPFDVLFFPAVKRGNKTLPSSLLRMRAQGSKLVLLAPAFGLLSQTKERHFHDADDVVAIPVTHGDLLRSLSYTTGRSLLGGSSEELTAQPTKDSDLRRNTRILLAEDGQANRMVEESMLRHLGFTVHSVANGVEAAEAVRSFPYDVVLMDLSMPEMDGFEATRRIREFEQGGPQTPIIAITAHAFDGTREQCMAAGMNEYVSKPIDSDRLLRAINKVTSETAEAVAELATDDDDELRIENMYLERIDRRAISQLAKDTSVDILPELVAAFVNEISGRATIISGAIRAFEVPVLAQESHVIKSSAGTFGAKQVCALATNLNQACKDNRKQDAVGLARELLAEIDLSTQAYRLTFDLPES